MADRKLPPKLPYGLQYPAVRISQTRYNYMPKGIIPFLQEYWAPLFSADVTITDHTLGLCDPRAAHLLKRYLVDGSYQDLQNQGLLIRKACPGDLAQTKTRLPMRRGELLLQPIFSYRFTDFILFQNHPIAQKLDFIGDAFTSAGLKKSFTEGEKKMLRSFLESIGLDLDLIPDGRMNFTREFEAMHAARIAKLVEGDLEEKICFKKLVRLLRPSMVTEYLETSAEPRGTRVVHLDMVEIRKNPAYSFLISDLGFESADGIPLEHICKQNGCLYVAEVFDSLRRGVFSRKEISQMSLFFGWTKSAGLSPKLCITDMPEDLRQQLKGLHEIREATLPLLVQFSVPHEGAELIGKKWIRAAREHLTPNFFKVLENNSSSHNVNLYELEILARYATKRALRADALIAHEFGIHTKTMTAHIEKAVKKLKKVIRREYLQSLVLPKSPISHTNCG